MAHIKKCQEKKTTTTTMTFRCKYLHEIGNGQPQKEPINGKAAHIGRNRIDEKMTRYDHLTECDRMLLNIDELFDCENSNSKQTQTTATLLMRKLDAITKKIQFLNK